MSACRVYSCEYSKRRRKDTQGSKNTRKKKSCVCVVFRNAGGGFFWLFIHPRSCFVSLLQASSQLLNQRNIGGTSYEYSERSRKDEQDTLLKKVKDKDYSRVGYRIS